MSFGDNLQKEQTCPELNPSIFNTCFLLLSGTQGLLNPRCHIPGVIGRKQEPTNCRGAQNYEARHTTIHSVWPT